MPARPAEKAAVLIQLLVPKNRIRCRRNSIRLRPNVHDSPSLTAKVHGSTAHFFNWSFAMKFLGIKAARPDRLHTRAWFHNPQAPRFVRRTGPKMDDHDPIVRKVAHNTDALAVPVRCNTRTPQHSLNGRMRRRL